jgi:hypothetical protein
MSTHRVKVQSIIRDQASQYLHLSIEMIKFIKDTYTQSTLILIFFVLVLYDLLKLHSDFGAIMPT